MPSTISSVALRLTKTGDNHQMQSLTSHSLCPSRLQAWIFFCALHCLLIGFLLSLALHWTSFHCKASHPLIHLKTDILAQSNFLSYWFLESDTLLISQKKKTLVFFFVSSKRMEWIDRFTHLCHSDEHHGPCLPASPPGDGAAKRPWGIFIALPAKHLLPITQRGQL